MLLKNLRNLINSINSINIVNSNPQFANLNSRSYNANLLNIKLFAKFSNFANLKPATTRIKLYIYIYIYISVC